jgi:glycosyltransferase involved in cell wall biosynthesis
LIQRILHVDSGREWRGGQRQVFLLASAQRDRGLEPLVVTPADSALGKRLRSFGVAVSAVKMRGEWDLASARRLRKLVRTWKPSVVHAHDARAHSLALAALVGIAVPLVVTRRVSFAPKGRLKYGGRVARFIAISGAVRQALLDAGVPDDRVDVVHSGVPTPRVDRKFDWRAEFDLPPDAIVCGMVGAMTVEKGADLLESIASALDEGNRERMHLVLLGGSRQRATRLGGLEVRRPGFIEDIHPAMAGLDMLWHPSQSEGLGTAVLDSMALGVPPVAFAVGGLREIIVDGESGLLVAPGDCRAFAHAATRLASDGALRHRIGEAGRARARAFDVDRMVTGTASSYEKALGAAGAG